MQALLKIYDYYYNRLLTPDISKIKDSKNLVLYLEGKLYANENSALMERSHIIDKIKSLNLGSSLVCCRINTVQELCQKIEVLNASNNRITNLIINAHGDAGFIVLNQEQGRFGYINEESLPQIAPAFQKLDADAHIILTSCCAGAGANSIAEKISQVANKKVFASAYLVWPYAMHFVQDTKKIGITFYAKEIRSHDHVQIFMPNKTHREPLQQSNFLAHRAPGNTTLLFTE